MPAPDLVQRRHRQEPGTRQPQPIRCRVNRIQCPGIEADVHPLLPRGAAHQRDRDQERPGGQVCRHFGGNLAGTWQADTTIRIVNAALRNGEPAPAGTGLGVQSLKGRSANVRAEVVEVDAGDLFCLSGVLQPDRPFRLHDRVVFIRPDPKTAWDKTRLYP